MRPKPFDVELQLQRHGAALRALAGEIVRDPWVADDAVQQVWLGALRRPPAHASAPGGWLATALRNVVRGFHRKDRRDARRERAVAEARNESIEDHAATLAREEQAQRLLAAVATLAAPFREAIWQRYFEGRAPREIAARTGLPGATVKSRLQRGLQQLRAKLGNDDGPRWRGAIALAFGHGASVPAGAATAWPGVLLMTTLTKTMAACAAVLAVACVWMWSFDDAGGASPSPPATAVAPAAAAAIRAAEPVERDAVSGVDERALRIANTPEAESTSRELLIEDDAGHPVAGATVWYVKPGFAYADLAPDRADLYSRSTASYLRDFGLAQLADEHGSTRIPIAAAQQVVVARKGDLYGTNWPRSDGAVQRIVVTAHRTFVVETVDARGAIVPHVVVAGLPILANGFANPMSQWKLGTTNEVGRLTHTVATGTASDPVAQIRQIRLHAELLDGPHGEQTIDAAAPPTFVRLILPDTGTVRARIEYSGGSALDPRVLDSLTAELGIVGDRRHTNVFLRGSRTLDYARLDAEGNACFENVVFDKKLQLRFPGVVVTPKTFAGPTAAQRVVTIVQTIGAEHPFVVGTLVAPDRRPIGNATFTLLAPTNGDLQLSVSGKTNAHGRFVAWLADRCTGRRGVVLQLGMDWGSTGPTREARVSVAGPLLGEVDLGTVVMPDPK